MGGGGNANDWSSFNTATGGRGMKAGWATAFLVYMLKEGFFASQWH